MSKADTQADTVAVMCHTATVVNLSFSYSIVSRRNPKYFPFDFSQKRRMLNMFISDGRKAFSAREALFKSSSEVVIQASGILFVLLK